MKILNEKEKEKTHQSHTYNVCCNFTYNFIVLDTKPQTMASAVRLNLF